MLKALGGICVVAGAVWLALLAVRRLRLRDTVLRQLTDGLSCMEKELSFRLTPILPMLERLGGRMRPPTGAFFETCCVRLKRAPGDGLRVAWLGAAEAKLSMLRPDELDAVLALGDVLGQYDADGQRAALRQAIGQLGCFQERAAEEAGRLGRVYAALCIAAGLAVVIVLM